jgi:hypothetical protein
MGDRISFSSELLRFEEVALSHADIANSIRFYYTAPSLANLDPKFIGYTVEETQREQNLRLDELDKSSVFSLLAALEASFKVDFYLRCYGRERDDLSRSLRAVFKEKGDRISLEEDIIETWKNHFPAAKTHLSELKGAFRYRHWLAHGRYWTPKLGRKYDFSSVYLIAQAIDVNFHLLSLD